MRPAAPSCATHWRKPAGRSRIRKPGCTCGRATPTMTRGARCGCWPSRASWSLRASSTARRGPGTSGWRSPPPTSGWRPRSNGSRNCRQHPGTCRRRGLLQDKLLGGGGQRLPPVETGLSGPLLVEVGHRGKTVGGGVGDRPLGHGPAEVTGLALDGSQLFGADPEDAPHLLDRGSHVGGTRFLVREPAGHYGPFHTGEGVGHDLGALRVLVVSEPVGAALHRLGRFVHGDLQVVFDFPQFFVELGA